MAVHVKRTFRLLYLR